MDKISLINDVLQQYFEQNSMLTIVPAKNLMPCFIKAGIFPANHKNGLPILNVLRKLDATKQLHRIPFVHAGRKSQNTIWYFRNASYIPSATPVPKQSITKNVLIKKSGSRKESDEQYVIDMCDKALSEVGLRQHPFDFLLGDPNGKGVCYKLPVDVYYSELNLVIEYKEQQHTKAVKHFDKPNILTVSGVHRGEQRKIYDQRRMDVLPKHGIQVIEISYELFSCSRQNKIIRNEESDLKIVKEYLNKQIQKLEKNKI